MTNVLDQIEKLLTAGTPVGSSDAVKLRAAERAVEKRAPFHRDRNSMADAMLIEIYGECVKARDAAGQRFAFVTHNKNDFSLVNGNQKLPHPDIASYFSRIKSLYFINLVELLRRIDPSLVNDVMFEMSWSQEPRGLSEILKAEDLLFHQVWYRVAAILDRDPDAIDWPFKAYATCPVRDDQWWPMPDCVPLQWAESQGKNESRRVLIERGAANRATAEIERAEYVVRFLRLACWDHNVHGKRDHRMHDEAARRLLAGHTEIARADIHTAIVCGDLEEVRRRLAARPAAARERGGARNWTPLLTLCYTRFTHAPTHDNAVAIARLLLDHGADANDFYMAGDAKYSALTGSAGEGEQDAPRQPYAKELFELLLECGAEPYDIQVLYNTHFSGDMLWWLELVYEHTINTPRGEAWKDPEWTMFDMGAYGSGARFVLETALKRRNLRLAEWALAHGANPNSAPARDKRFPKTTLWQEAMRQGFTEMADLLLRYGASSVPAESSDRENLVPACLRLDRDEVLRLFSRHPEFMQLPDPLFVAAEQDRADVAAFVLDLGVSPDVADANNERPLHRAASTNALAVAKLLLDRGAEVDVRDSRYHATPLGWASHFDHAGMVTFLSRFSHDFPMLCFTGSVDRVRELLADDSSLATQIDDDGITPLWWLPDDEAKALEVVEALLSAGANPSVRSKEGQTAAGAARRRGLLKVAERLGAALA